MDFLNQERVMMSNEHVCCAASMACASSVEIIFCETLTMVNSRFLRMSVLVCGVASLPRCWASNLKVEVQEKSEPKFVVSSGNDSTPIGGICVEILRLLETHQPGLHFSFVLPPLPLARIVKNMEMGYADVGCLVETPERKLSLRGSSLPLFAYDFRLIARAEDPVEIATWDDVRNLGKDGTVLVLKNSGAKAKLLAIGRVTMDDGAETVEQNLKKLVAGRARFFFYPTAGIDEKLKQAGVDGKVKVLPNIIESVQFKLLFGKNVPAELVRRIDADLIESEQNGSLAKIRKRWNSR